MIEVPALKNEDMSKFMELNSKSNYQRIPNSKEVTKQFVAPQQINEKVKTNIGNITIERKAYIIESLINNYGLKNPKIILEQRYSQGPSWSDGSIIYLPSFFPFFRKIHIDHPDELATCQIARNLIDNYLQTPNVKCSLYGIGFIKTKTICLNQLLVFEIIHFNDIPFKDKIPDIRYYLNPNFVPIKIPFIQN
ncbi:MAG: hypothetical protein PHH12_02615 [Candidatus Shapirobacteria bacterium]|nr:hypothetical protein [Candidatus Shapirobacteria bacterium]